MFFLGLSSLRTGKAIISLINNRCVILISIAVLSFWSTLRFNPFRSFGCMKFSQERRWEGKNFMINAMFFSLFLFPDYINFSVAILARLRVTLFSAIISVLNSCVFEKFALSVSIKNLFLHFFKPSAIVYLSKQAQARKVKVNSRVIYAAVWVLIKGQLHSHSDENNAQGGRINFLLRRFFN